jgi:hypothetical protein
MLQPAERALRVSGIDNRHAARGAFLQAPMDFQHSPRSIDL